MKVELFLNKTVDENAALYYEKAKKAKSKLDGITTAIENAKEGHAAAVVVSEPVIKKEKVQRKQEWYEKFRWMFTSQGKLVIGGRDASTNEIVIKKHTQQGDLVFHTDMAGSPFMVLKANGEVIEDIEKEEVAEFLACYSRAWKAGITAVEVFYVNPDQVSKEAQAGEYLSKGSFMIRGKTNYITALLKMGLTVIKDQVFVGAIPSIKAKIKEEFADIPQHEQEKKYVRIVQGSQKASQTAKEIKKLLGGDLDEIIKMLPPGGTRIGK
jgi:predicted ribosome quality control (RQC) complex YloA/Tae2 family protein